MLVPKMWTFILAISCLTTSSLPWFMDLTFQVPMQYCYLKHRTLFLSPVTSTTVCCFCFGSTSSFFMKLFFYWSPVAYWAPMCPFLRDLLDCSQPSSSVYGVFQAKIPERVAILFSRGSSWTKDLTHFSTSADELLPKDISICGPTSAGRSRRW